MPKKKTAQQIKKQYDKLIAVFRAFGVQSKPKVTRGVPDYSASGMKAQKALIPILQKRYESIDTTDWTVAKKVDYVLVGAQIRGWQFEHDVLAPWKKDPASYVPIDFQFGPKMHQAVPSHLLKAEHFADAADSTQRDYLTEKVRAFEEILTQAKDNLSSRSSSPKTAHTMLAVRNTPRQLATMDQFIESLTQAGNPFAAEATAARKAIKAFGQWAKQNRATRTSTMPAGSA